MDTPAMVLCTFILAMIVSSITAITPMDKMNAEIMSDYMDLQRKVMKYKMIQSSFGGQKGGNSMFPPGLQNLFNSLGGMGPSISSVSQTGITMPEVPPATSIGQQNLQPASKTVKAKTTVKLNSSKPKTGKVQSPTNTAVKKSTTSSGKQTPGAGMMGNVPPVVGSTLEQNPMMGLDMAAMMNAASMMNNAGGSMFGQGQITNPSNPTQKGVPPMTSSGMSNGQAGTWLPQTNMGLFLMQQDLCSETPSKLRTMCTTNKNCNHGMQCSTGRCCATDYGQAERLDNMVELLERQRVRQALLAL